VVEEYFKMMGGLRSMVELGFSMVALCNFGSKSWELLKKIVVFLARSSKKMFCKLSGTSHLVSKMAAAFDAALMLSPNSKNGSSALNKIYLGLRVLAGLILLVSINLKTKLQRDIENEHEEILKEYEDIKLEEQQANENELVEEHNLYLKEGYF
jgi:hypothetical protein